ncbi:hypothetical protein BCAL_3001 [Bifidobacterium callitrichos DSM 23973]|uniref:Uncharacterized protein n=1 Tax=Bifidobacterium callitrichos DSM 23973 TaxID=1437609 RepID=A0A087A7K3_9BIFI|nr:hypothetical protein BCAL_3001 [Bifidobacterium callitrichos DSM 23973]
MAPGHATSAMPPICAPTVPSSYACHFSHTVRPSHAAQSHPSYTARLHPGGVAQLCHFSHTASHTARPHPSCAAQRIFRRFWR